MLIVEDKILELYFFTYSGVQNTVIISIWLEAM